VALDSTVETAAKVAPVEQVLWAVTVHSVATEEPVPAVWRVGLAVTGWPHSASCCATTARFQAAPVVPAVPVALAEPAASAATAPLAVTAPWVAPVATVPMLVVVQRAAQAAPELAWAAQVARVAQVAKVAWAAKAEPAATVLQVVMAP